MYVVYITIYSYTVFICIVTLFNWSKVTRCMLSFTFINLYFLLLLSFLLYFFVFVFCLTDCLFTLSLLCLRSKFVGYITNKLTCHVKTVVA